MAKTKSKAIFWIYGNLQQCRNSWDGIVSHVEQQSGKKPYIQLMFGGINSIGATSAQRWSSANDVIFSLRNKSFFDDSPRIIKVCGLPESYQDLADWFHVINGTNVLVIQSPFGYIKPGSKRWVTAKTSKFYKKVKSEGFVIEHPVEANNERSAITWIDSLFKESKKSIQHIVLREIVVKEGKNLDRLENVVKKLCTYQKSKEITIEDVHSCCISRFLPETVWQFLEDLDYKREDRALAYLQAFYAEGDGVAGESFYGRINKLFGAMVQHFQFLLILKDVCGQRDLNTQLIEDVLQGFKKTTPTKILELKQKKINYDDLEPRFSRQYINSKIKQDGVRVVFRRKKSEIYKVLAALYDCIYFCRINSGCDYYLRLCLDIFALIACGKLTPDQARQIQGNE